MTSSIVDSIQWEKEAKFHANEMNDLLYPYKGKNWKTRFHAVHVHPIYNFLHSYYRYSITELKLYSPGVGNYIFDNVTHSGQYLLHPLVTPIDMNDESCSKYALQLTPTVIKSKRYNMNTISRSKDILESTIHKNPYFSCYGMHEWAMLYSSRSSQEIDPSSRHQSKLKLRVSQKIIDDAVESKVLTCTHYDAWRFFNPSAQPMNVINPLTRQNQLEHEQPGCIHATMDLFKYAHQLYPYVSSEILRETIQIALNARKIDMRASPYDVSHIEGCEIPICVETNEGKLLYAKEQMSLYNTSMPIRKKLFQIYTEFINLYNKVLQQNN